MTLKYLYFAGLSSPKMLNLNQIEKDFTMIFLIGTDLFKEDPTAKENCCKLCLEKLPSGGSYVCWLKF